MAAPSMPISSSARYAALIAQWLLLALTLVFLVAAPLAYIFASEGLALVNQHFGEPHSTYPALSVALFAASCAALTGLAALYLMQVKQLFVDHTAQAPIEQTAQTAWRMAWLMLGMFVTLYPVAQYGLIVEIAFKGPTSEVTAPFWLPANLALIGGFALAAKLSSPNQEPAQ